MTYKTIFIALLLLATMHAVAQTDSIRFKKETRVFATQVKNQGQTGTCWSFATTSFLESEAWRISKHEVELSEMYNVRYAYRRKALRYADEQSKYFSEGGLAHDVIDVVRNFGAVPRSMYSGKLSAQQIYDHSEYAVLQEAILRSAKVPLSQQVLQSLNAMADIYIGAIPDYFDYGGVIYSPRTFAADYLGINPDDYYEFTSYTHHPFYEDFALEVPDNWIKGRYYNLPIDELMKLIDNALDSGFSVAWDGDVSEAEFMHKKGIAILPQKEWSAKTPAEKDATGVYYEDELIVTQELRQTTFDDKTTTDDHLMHIIGTVSDTKGTKYYITKNSWGTTSNDMGGYLYMSEPYVRLKMLAVMVHKDAVPKKIRKKTFGTNKD